MRFVGIDPSTKTGFVAIDENDNVLKQKELLGVGDVDPKRMVTLINEIIVHVQPDDVICIEGFPYDTQKAMFAGGLHHGIRNELFKRNISYYEAAPNAVKKFVGVTGWIGEKGKKTRLTGPAKKQAVIRAVAEQFTYTHTSDNVVDAYIMARIAKALYMRKQSFFLMAPNQLEVIEQIINPETKAK